MAKYEDLTIDQWHKLAELIAEETLSDINATLDEVVPADGIYVRYGKRIVDIVFSATALGVTLPLNIVFALCTYIDVGRPIIFKQSRLGKDAKPFELIKFRNMTNETDSRGNLLPASQRTTKFGQFMRKTSLDELLNFWSVFKGDMSIIGPRPLPIVYGCRLNRRHGARLKVRPGLECPPRNVSDRYWSWQEQFENDVWYVENVSFKTDIYMFYCLIKYTFDKKSSIARSKGDVRGSFIGYDTKGRAITEEDISFEMIERFVH